MNIRGLGVISVLYERINERDYRDIHASFEFFFNLDARGHDAFRARIKLAARKTPKTTQIMIKIIIHFPYYCNSAVVTQQRQKYPADAAEALKYFFDFPLNIFPKALFNIYHAPPISAEQESASRSCGKKHDSSDVVDHNPLIPRKPETEPFKVIQQQRNNRNFNSGVCQKLEEDSEKRK